MTIYLFLTVLTFAISLISCIQSNNTCAPIPKDKRQLVCQCSKQLQLTCMFNIDIKEIHPNDLDKTLKPIYFGDVSLSRTSVNPDQPYRDINYNFEKNFYKNKNSNKVYLYFPDFKVLDSPYIRVTLLRFLFIPSFAFYDKGLFLESKNGAYNKTSRSIGSVIFELGEVQDFGIDRFAFYGLRTDFLIIEGPFNQMTIHKEAFYNTNIEELTIGCYCIECETFFGDCRINFNQKSSHPETFSYKKDEEHLAANIKSLKLYGVQLGDNTWNLDDLPNIENLERLEISNSMIKESNNGLTNDIELKSVKNLTFKTISEFVFRNNGLRILRNQNFLQYFSNLKILTLNDNQLAHIDSNAFNNIAFTEINLERNKLERIDKYLFTKSTMSQITLRRLVFKENLIKELADFTFSQLKNLEHLDLSRNKLTSLTDKTFDGLISLKELILSFNPLKSIDINTFKFLSPSLTRLDLISKSESDWFIFDENDICMFAYLRCKTQIHIDFDQRCNCFIKYTNLISDQNTKQTINKFKPCSFEQLAKKDEDQYDLDENTYAVDRDPSSIYTAKKEEQLFSSKIICPNNFLSRCFDAETNNSNIEVNRLKSQSCLYNRIIENENLKLKQYPESNNFQDDPYNEVKTLASDEKDVAEPVIKAAASILSDSSSSSLSEIVQKKDLQSFQSPNRINNSNSNLIEKNFKYICIGMGIVFLVSLTSLSLTVYLLIKRRNHIVYHPTDGYPQDER